MSKRKGMNGFVGTYAVKSEGIAATHCKEVGGGSSDKSKKKMKSALKDKRTEDERFSGTFADYMNQLQEKTEEREQRKLKERMEKEAALKAKKKEDLENALSFVDGQIKSSSDLSDEEEEENEKQTGEKEEESMFQWNKNYESEGGGISEALSVNENWTENLVWGEIKGQEQSLQRNVSLEAPSAMSTSILGGMLYRKVKTEEDIEDKVTQDMCSTSASTDAKQQDLEDKVTQDMCSTSTSTDAKPQDLKIEKFHDVSKEKLSFFVKSGQKIFQLTLDKQKKVKKVRAAVAGQLGVKVHRVELQVIKDAL